MTDEEKIKTIQRAWYMARRRWDVAAHGPRYRVYVPAPSLPPVTASMGAAAVPVNVTAEVVELVYEEGEVHDERHWTITGEYRGSKCLVASGRGHVPARFPEPKPVFVLETNHARFEQWPDNVRTVFADGKDVTAAPNEGETMMQCTVHEYLHTVIQEALSDRPSFCLRAVADGDGHRWTENRRFEEGLAYSMTPRIVALIEALLKEMGRT